MTIPLNIRSGPARDADASPDQLAVLLLTPLRRQSDGGTRTFEALRAYIDAECNHSSAAHALGVGRHTMERRVRAAEELLGCPLRACLPELDVALRLEERNLSGTRFA